MKTFLCLCIAFAAPLLGNQAPFASQSDLVADLSDSLLNGIYRNSLSCDPDACTRGLWLQGFGNTRERDSRSNRSHYDNDFGGLIAGFNCAPSYNTALSFFIGGSWGEISINNESTFDTQSIFLGTAWERLCTNRFYGFAVAVGYLEEDRHFGGVHEEPQGVFLSPEITYSQLCPLECLCPVFTSTLRYAGFFSQDYAHRETDGTLYVRDRSIQLITARGEVAFLSRLCICPYVGAAGRFQLDGHHITGRLLQEHRRFNNELDQGIVYGFLGARFSAQWRCLDIHAYLEGSYDTDSSRRLLGKLDITYRY